MRALLIGLFLVVAPCSGMAHGLLLDAESDGRTITGTAYYSNGEKAANEAVSLLDLATPGAGSKAIQTDAEGNFRFDVEPSHRYRVAVYGDEGHSVELELDAVASARPKLIDGDTTPQQSWLPPAWALVGSILLASLVPALLSRQAAGPGSPASSS